MYIYSFIHSAHLGTTSMLSDTTPVLYTGFARVVVFPAGAAKARSLVARLRAPIDSIASMQQEQLTSATAYICE